MKIKEISSKSDIIKFIKFPRELYKNNKQYVPSLDADEYKILTKSPSLEYCKLKLWLAYDNEDKIVGRVAGIFNPHANEFANLKRVRFGWIDFIEDFDVAKGLLERVEEWGRELGMEEIHGPLSYNTWGKQGMLIEGFDKVPPFNCIYNFSYYPQYLDKLGYGKQIDWIQKEILIDQSIMDKRLIEMSNRILVNNNLKLLDIRDVKDIDLLAKRFFESFNKSFVNIENFSPLTDAEISEIAKDYFPKLNPELTSIIVDEHDNIAAFGVCLPSLSKAFQKANGKLFPFGVFHILRALRKYSTIDFMLVGAAPEWQHKGVTSVFHTHIGYNVVKRKVVNGISNPQKEDDSVHKVWDRYSSAPYMRRRCYIKNI